MGSESTKTLLIKIRLRFTLRLKSQNKILGVLSTTWNLLKVGNIIVSLILRILELTEFFSEDMFDNILDGDTPLKQKKKLLFFLTAKYTLGNKKNAQE